MADQFTRRVAVIIMALAVSILTVNAASLYLQFRIKTDIERRVESLELDRNAQKRKNEQIDKLLNAIAEGSAAKMR